MKLTPLPVAGAFMVEIEARVDERGFFARTYCREEFARAGLAADFVQTSISFNVKAGTLRGMHYQDPPKAEAKLVRCTMGAAYDVVLDLRPDSPSYRRWAAVEITAKNRVAIFIPPRCAHGFQTLVDETELLYEISEFYDPSAARGVRFDDPTFAIDWPPAERRIISERDLALPMTGA